LAANLAKRVAGFRAGENELKLAPPIVFQT
jgi:hypothetical protein